MSTTSTAPVVTVDAREDGTATITVDGVATQLRDETLERVTMAAVRHIANVVAAPIGSAVTVRARNPREGESLLQIAPSGKVTPVAAPAPVQQPQQAPVQQPQQAPVQQPQQAPVQEPIQAPVREPIQAPVREPIQAPVREPIQAPVQQPIQAPVQQPIQPWTRQPAPIQQQPAPAARRQPAPAQPQHFGHDLPAQQSGPAPEVPQTRRLTARDFAESKPAPPAAPAAEGWRGSANRTSGLRLAPGRVELSRRQRRAAIQRGIAGHKTILVLNEKGGVGKTTVTWCLGATLGRVRGGTVLAWDNNEYKGTLGIRSQATGHDHTARDLLTYIEAYPSASHTAELVNFVRPQGENKFDVLASQSLNADSDVLDAAAFTKLHGNLSRFYRLIVVDSGNNSSAETWRAAVAAADVLVFATIAKEDSARSVASLADTLIAQGHHEKVANAVTIIGHVSPTTYPDLERRVAQHMGQLTRAVVTTPYDRALDRGDVIDYDALTPRSREAWLTATAAVMDGLK